MQERTRGIVLHTIKYGDSSLIVDIFTEQRGTVGFIMRMPRSRKSGLNTVLLRPLNIVELDFDFRPTQSLQKVRDMRVCVPYLSIPYHPLKETMALFLGEFLYYALRKEDVNTSLFCYLVSAFSWFDEADAGYENFHLALLIHISLFLGIWPNADEYHTGDFFDLAGGQFVGIAPVHGAYLNLDEAAMLGKYLRMDYTNMRRFHLTRTIRQRVLECLNMYYRLHIPEFPELKSLAILHEVLN